MTEQLQSSPLTDAQIASLLSTNTPDGRARAAALHAVCQSSKRPTSIVTYRSEGTVLIIGPEAPALNAATELKDRLTCTVLITGVDSKEGEQTQNRDHLHDGITVVRQPLRSLMGHLGEFVAVVNTPKGEVNLAKASTNNRDTFDLVLDFSPLPILDYEIVPLGYYTIAKDVGVETMLAELPEMVGEFEKPKYFEYNPNICAHGNSELKGCTNCLDACPTSAIHSIGNLIEVDPYLCQGGGSCATACPTGAIQYAFPKASDLLNDIKQLLHTYLREGGHQPVLLFHDETSGKAIVERLGSHLSEHVIPVQVEELGSVGPDIWLASLAYGAREIVLLATLTTPSRILNTIKTQIARVELYRGYRSLTTGITGLLALVAAALQSIWLPNPAMAVDHYVDLWLGVATISAVISP